MKDISITTASWKMLRILLLLLLLSPLKMLAQADSSAKKETEEDALIAPALDFVTVQKSDKSIDLKAAVKAKIKGVFTKLALLKISFVQVNDTTEKVLGFIITNDEGKGVLNIKDAALAPLKDGSLQLKAVFAGNKKMDPADAEVTIKRAYIEITPVKEDSLLTVKAKLVVPGSETDSSVKDVTLAVFVNRTFNPLKIGEGTTDESGEVSVEIPNNLPGDDKGNITLLAKLDDNETFGNLEAASVQKWGTPVSDKIENQPRALWSSHPPIWMLITFIVLMVVVWGHYIVIVYQLFRLRKEEPAV
jgi:hypothetical protein